MEGQRTGVRSPSPDSRAASVGRTICTQTDSEQLVKADVKQHVKSESNPTLDRRGDWMSDALMKNRADGAAAGAQLCYPQPRPPWQTSDPFALNAAGSVCPPRAAIAGDNKWTHSVASGAAVSVSDNGVRPQQHALTGLTWSQPPLSYTVDAMRQPAAAQMANNGKDAVCHQQQQQQHQQFSAGKSDWRRPAATTAGVARGAGSAGSSKLSFDGSLEQGEMLSPTAMAILEQPVCSMVVEGGSDSGGSPCSYPELSAAGRGGGGPWRCDDCGRVLSCSASLRRHRAVHSGVRPHVCNQCGRAFTTQAYLNGHMRSHTGEKPFMCPICARCFTRSTGLTRHMELHVSNKLGGPAATAGQPAVGAPHTPAVAGAAHGAPAMRQPLAPVAMVAPGAGGPYTLSAGGAALTEMVPVCVGAPLLSAVQAAPAMTSPAVVSTAVASAGGMSAPSHDNTIAGHTARAQCPVCAKMFTRQLSVKVHMRIHTGERPHKCQQCDKTFKNASHLRVHVRTHTNERRYPCSVCGKRFTESSSLRRHMRIHTGERPYECEFCGKEMRYLNHMKSHRRKHTGETPYQCGMCGQLFRHQQTYRLHMRKHNGDLPTCDVCGKSFSNRSRLDEHMRQTHAMPLDGGSPASSLGMAAGGAAETAGAAPDAAAAKARHFLDMIRQHADEDPLSPPEMSAQGLDFRCRGAGSDAADVKPAEDKPPSPQIAVDYGGGRAVGMPSHVEAHKYPVSGHPLLSMPYPLSRAPTRVPDQQHVFPGDMSKQPDHGPVGYQHHQPRQPPGHKYGTAYHPHSSPQSGTQDTHATNSAMTLASP